jgi:crotonobetainyl-CoA:carnitine CoA-transferase CaiB-like acyl-CoA transferase
MEALAPDGWTRRLDGMRLPPSPIVVDGARLPARRPPPLLGEHTVEVLGGEAADGQAPGT